MIDGHDVAETVKTIIEDGNKKEPNGLKPKSVDLAFLLFALIGLSHSYSLHTLLIALTIFGGLVGTKLLLWNLRNTGIFDNYSGLFFETVPLALANYAMGWLIRAVFDFFGWSLV